MAALNGAALRALGLFVLVAVTAALPTPEGTTASPVSEDATLSTELRPPPKQEGEPTYAVFVINLYGVKNMSGESDEEMFENSLTEKVPELLDPLATVLLVVRTDEEEESAVDLEEIAKNLEKSGMNVERVGHDGETRLIRVRMDNQDLNGIMDTTSKTTDEERVRRKRTICFKCKKGGGKGGYGGGGYGGGGGGCGGGCGGGGGGYPGGGFPSGPAYHPGGGGGGYPGGGYPIGGGGGGYPGGGGGGYPGGGYPGGGGGGYHPGGGGGGGYPGGGGGYHQPSGGGQCNTCGGGGGGSGSYATASAGAISWGK